MFPRKERLPRASMPFALKNGRRFSSEHFTAVVPEKTKGYAVIIPKKVARLSVTRHRIKRRVLEALRALPLPAAFILFPKSSVSQLEQSDIKRELADLLSKISR